MIGNHRKRWNEKENDNQNGNNKKDIDNEEKRKQKINLHNTTLLSIFVTSKNNRSR